jgi:RND family efflux transporter MFP subunit
LKVILNVAEQDAFRLKVGDQTEIETAVYPGIKFYGTIASISAKGDAAHTYPVKIVIPNNNQHPLKSGMFGQITINFGNQVALSIPRNALIGGITNPQVFVVEDGKAQLRNIQVGSEIGTNIAVMQGLHEGETVVVSGQEGLKDNMTVSTQDAFSQNATPNSASTKWGRQGSARKQKHKDK